jgi:urease accessory protein
VSDALSLTAWIESVLARAAGHVDAALLAAAWRATDADDAVLLVDIVERAAAWRASAEMALESEAQGAAFMAATRAAWSCRALDRLASIARDLPIALPVAVGCATAGHGVPLRSAVAAYLQGFAANLVSAGLRLIPLGQTAGQRVIAALEPAVAAAVEIALSANLDEIGTAAPLVDWCSMRHETQYTRLFRS